MVTMTMRAPPREAQIGTPLVGSEAKAPPFALRFPKPPNVTIPDLDSSLNDSGDSGDESPTASQIAASFRRFMMSLRDSSTSISTKASIPPPALVDSDPVEESLTSNVDESAERKQMDKVVERIKTDRKLGQYEKQLLTCIVDPASLSTTFSQVHLPQDTLDSIRTMASLTLLCPTAFERGILKDHRMTGCLLYGPPGTGKTLVVRALAKEAGSRMLSVTSADIMSKGWGDEQKSIRALFSLARRLSPCIIFIDEIDTLLGARTSTSGSGTERLYRTVVTEFMQEMDGLKSNTKSNVIVIGATNRPFDLDDAILRRLPCRLFVDLPSKADRETILSILLQDEELSPDVDLRVIAEKTRNFSGSDLKHLCVAATLAAVKQQMHIPWRVNTLTSLSEADQPLHERNPGKPDFASPNVTCGTSSLTTTPHLGRILTARNFERALMEVFPSTSESLGSLSRLRKWNEELGGGSRIQEDRQESAQTENSSNHEDSADLIERVRQAGDLDAYEQRLLRCIIDPATLPTSLSDVHLPSHIIDSLWTIASLSLQCPEEFQHGILKEHRMTGCLLFGPPGTGKTLIVRALAKEAGTQMLAVSSADIMQMCMGEEEKIVKALFSLARRLSPCVIFIDEVDAIFGTRRSSESSTERAYRAVVTEFMQEMDGLRSSAKDHVTLIGATNRPFDLDEAMLRRFPRRLLLDLPSAEDREEILKIMLRGEHLCPNVDVNQLARQTDNFSGSDLKHLCVSAALHAVKQRVDLPWRSRVSKAAKPSTDTIPSQSRVRCLRSLDFQVALTEITPSIAETDCLASLRRWDEKFGEGRRNPKITKYDTSPLRRFTVRPHVSDAKGAPSAPSGGAEGVEITEQQVDCIRDNASEKSPIFSTSIAEDSIWLGGQHDGFQLSDFMEYEVIRLLHTPLDHHDQCIPNLAALRQSQMIFGLIEAVTEQSLQEKDLVQRDPDGNTIISTSNLPNILREWLRCIRTLKRQDPDLCLQWFRRAHATLEQARRRLEDEILSKFGSLRTSGLHHREVVKILRMFAAIAETLDVLVYSIYPNEEPVGGWGIVSAVDDARRRDMIANGWCPSIIPSLLRLICLSEFAATRRPFTSRETETRHGDCTEDNCLMNTIDVDQYTNRHVTTACQCQHLKPPLESMIGFLSAGHLPIVDVANTTSPGGSLDMTCMSASWHPYIAFSHV
ncbi:AAA-domain-containing protein [Obba rivulosa]|uniref:AAA-domain-containing protein n=1 Tax=Obba rivulosa TaxID=1052685 RepID=A0A8E2AUF3_9APHY|nr:AAA-domain-containing protein [Obba rivulosa]